MKNTSDVVVIGGGLIGLSTACALAESGVSVTVFDAGEPGQASTAAAGMLAPLAEADRLPNTFLALALQSLASYDGFTEDLKDRTGIDAQPYGPGMLRVAYTEADENGLRRDYEQQCRSGLPLFALNREEAQRAEPNLGGLLRFAVLSPQERSVDPRLLHEAVKRACPVVGVQICEGVAVIGLCGAVGRVQSVLVPQGSFSCETVVLTGGAWSPRIARRLGIALPVRPVRGQMLALGPCSPPPLRHTIYSAEGYLVPRPDGRVVVGATEEDAGFEAGTTADGVAGLRAMAQSLVLGLADAPLQSAWAGLRPVSLDGLPIIGRAPGWQNVYIGTGHGRNGILLTPVTASLLAQGILTGAELPECFSPARFEATTP